ncbi:MAG: hypothetical protein ABIJ86_00455, partial [Spirochaetota bacterium]
KKQAFHCKGTKRIGSMVCKNLSEVDQMQNQVTLSLSDNLYRSAEQLAAGVKRPVQSVLTDVLSTALGVWDFVEEPVQLWSDERVLAVCESQMSPEQSDRLSKLLDKQQAGRLTTDERPEIWALMRIYEIGQLRKAKALAEAVRRGLRPPGNV